MTPNIYPDHYTVTDIIADVIFTDEGTLRGTVTEATHALADAGYLTPDPQIIRSKTELVTLDPDAVLIDSDGEVMDAGRMQKNLCGFGHMSLYSNPFPALVVATAEQVRAARRALEEA